MLYHLLSSALLRICNILHKHFNILHSSYRCKDVFKQPPFVAYRHIHNLRKLLVIAQLPVISNNCSPPGSSRWGQNCGTCLYITIGLTRCTFYATGETRSITSHITCNTKNVIYIVQCNRCNLQYIGETKRRLKDRFNEHRRAVDKTNAPINVMPAGGRRRQGMGLGFDCLCWPWGRAFDWSCWGWQQVNNSIYLFLSFSESKSESCHVFSSRKFRVCMRCSRAAQSELIEVFNERTTM